jgi:hypothetical protein
MLCTAASCASEQPLDIAMLKRLNDHGSDQQSEG